MSDGARIGVVLARVSLNQVSRNEAGVSRSPMPINMLVAESDTLQRSWTPFTSHGIAEWIAHTYRRLCREASSVELAIVI